MFGGVSDEVGSVRRRWSAEENEILHSLDGVTDQSELEKALPKRMSRDLDSMRLILNMAEDVNLFNCLMRAMMMKAFLLGSRTRVGGAQGVGWMHETASFAV